MNQYESYVYVYIYIFMCMQWYKCMRIISIVTAYSRWCSVMLRTIPRKWPLQPKRLRRPSRQGSNRKGCDLSILSVASKMHFLKDLHNECSKLGTAFKNHENMRVFLMLFMVLVDDFHNFSKLKESCNSPKDCFCNGCGWAHCFCIFLMVSIVPLIRSYCMKPMRLNGQAHSTQFSELAEIEPCQPCPCSPASPLAKNCG